MAFEWIASTCMNACIGAGICEEIRLSGEYQMVDAETASAITGNYGILLFGVFVFGYLFGGFASLILKRTFLALAGLFLSCLMPVMPVFLRRHLTTRKLEEFADLLDKKTARHLRRATTDGSHALIVKESLEAVERGEEAVPSRAAQRLLDVLEKHTRDIHEKMLEEDTVLYMTDLDSSLRGLNWLVAKGGADPTEKSPPKTSSSSPRVKDEDKPPFSYSQLIKMAIDNSPEHKCSLNGIYTYISDHFSYYKENRNGSWRNSIRHNLSLNKQFKRLDRKEGEKGSLWVCVGNGDKKPRSIDGSPPRINPAVQRIYQRCRQSSLEQNLSSPPNYQHVHSPHTNGHTFSMTNGVIGAEEPSCSTNYSSPIRNIDSVDSIVSEMEIDDISDLSLFESHDLSASFKKVYDQVFHGVSSSGNMVQETQIDWLKIGLEAAGMDYRNEDELRLMDTERFTEYMKNGFPDGMQSDESTPRALSSRGLSNDISLAELNTSLNRNNGTTVTTKEESDEDEFDWNSIM